MKSTEQLKLARNTLLRLHKAMLDGEREVYEGHHGPLNATEFLNILLEDQDFAWLRKFSMLIVEIDELFALKDGINQEMVTASLARVLDLVEMKEPDESFRTKYQFAIQRDPQTAGLQSELRNIFSGGLS